MNSLNHANRPLQAVGYRRVSMQEQVNGHSLDAQESNIQSYVKDQGWELQNIYVDAGISAKKGSSRPAFEQLMKDASDHKFDVVVVDKIDRFYRHLSGLLTSLDTLHSHGIAFASVQEKLDFTTPWGKLMLTVLGMLAEIYIDNLRQETRKGKIQRARKGLWLGGIPFGYCNGLCSKCTDPNGPDYCPSFGLVDKGDGKVIIPHPLESQVVRQVFDWYVTGDWSYRSIASALNEMSIELPDGRVIPARQKGLEGKTAPGPFNRDVVRDMLKRLAYTGKIPYRAVDVNGLYQKRHAPTELCEGLHQPLISSQTFDLAQEIRILRARLPDCNERPAQIFPLTGSLYCARCGGHMRGISRAYNDKRYYICSNREDRLCKCAQRTVHADAIELQVIHWIKQVITSASPENLDLLQLHAEEQEKRFQRAQELYLAGEFSHEKYEQEKTRRENFIQSLQEHETQTIIEFRKRILPQIDMWDNLSQLNKKRLPRFAVEAIFIHGNAFVGCTPKVAFLPLVRQVPCLCGKGGIRTRGGGFAPALT